MLQLNIVGMAASFEGSRPFGPASTLRRYLDHLGLTISGDGFITGPDFMTFNVLHDLVSALVSGITKFWPHFLFASISRKGVGDYLPHYSLTSRVFSSFSASDQAILARNMLGGFQTAGIQTKWDKDTSPICSLCNKEDSRTHCSLECEATADVRHRHPEAIKILTDIRPEWSFIPLARSHPDQILQKVFVHTTRDQDSLETGL